MQINDPPQQISTKIYGIVPYCELIFSSTQEKYFGHVENAILLAHRRAQDYTIQARTKVIVYKSYGELFFIIDSYYNVKFLKGQLSSKCPFGVFKSPKKPTNFFPGYLP